MPNEPIAIIGSACRFAGEATSPAKLWDLLRDPHDVLSGIPESRFSSGGFYHPDGSFHGRTNVRDSYFLSEDIRAFDARFFGVKPVEAKAIDPQHRMLLEVAYESLESAGLPLASLRGSNTAVYAGQMCNDYEAHLSRDFQAIPTYFGTGVSRSMAANRLSYFFDWHGPSISIDTACSSSLIAVHLATQALRAGDTDMALACGTNLLLGPENYVTESKLRMLSPDGRSHMWDKRANGYGRGDGVAVLVLKTLSAALRDGDHIECVVRETGTNQDGSTQGITVPSATAQETLIRETYARAGLDVSPSSCQYFEAHGTGTPAGDPVEARAIQQAFIGDPADSPTRTGDRPLYVGSVKTMLGHTEGTAGIAAVLKASLALQHSSIPPNLLFDEISPAVAPFYGGLQILRSAIPWPDTVVAGEPRRASVNSFGFGGSNAHAILESFDHGGTPRRRDSSRPNFAPFLFSAASEESLTAGLRAWSAFLAKNTSVDAQDLAWNLHQRRTTFPFRIAFPATNLELLRASIDDHLSGAKPLNADRTLSSSPSSSSSASSSSKPTKILGVFTGQGAQYARMAAELIETSSFARKRIQELEAYLSGLPEQDRPAWSLEAELLADAAASRLHEAALAQPLCTAVQILLVDLLCLANVKFAGVVGHSSGEIGAAYAAGHLSARDAMLVAYYRGFHAKLASSSNGDAPGAMLAAGCSVGYATELCSLPEFAGRVTIAACNSGDSVTLSGDLDAIVLLEDVLEDEKKFRRRLKVDKAYHSAHMAPCSEPYVQSLRASGVQMQPGSPGCVWYSSVYDGSERFEPSELGLSISYWADNMARPVLFQQAVTRAVFESKFELVLEVGPHPALQGPASQVIQETLPGGIAYTGTLSRTSNAVAAVSAALGFVWRRQEHPSLDLSRYAGTLSEDDESFSVLKNLPSYQWDHDTLYWHESRQSRMFRQRQGRKPHPLLGDLTVDSSAHQMSWRNLLRNKEMPWVSGHQLQNQTVFPAAGYLASALEAARTVVVPGGSIRLIDVEDFEIHQALVFDEEDSGIEVITSLTDIRRGETAGVAVYEKFSYSAAVGKDTSSSSLALVASAKIHAVVWR